MQKQMVIPCKGDNTKKSVIFAHVQGQPANYRISICNSPQARNF